MDGQNDMPMGDQGGAGAPAQDPMQTPPADDQMPGAPAQDPMQTPPADEPPVAPTEPGAPAGGEPMPQPGNGGAPMGGDQPMPSDDQNHGGDTGGGMPQPGM